ncbi:hypothetical protein BJ742DRAFT_846021 [Cladochytrium replicatum]|nr:hypothetical protein BJ742DRAFT_846021 [Cladochytrium replicatum]
MLHRQLFHNSLCGSAPLLNFSSSFSNSHGKQENTMEDDLQLHEEFKNAANSLALLYKQAHRQRERSYQAGYTQALHDLLLTLARQPPGTSAVPIPDLIALIRTKLESARSSNTTPQQDEMVSNPSADAFQASAVQESQQPRQQPPQTPQTQQRAPSSQDSASNDVEVASSPSQQRSPNPTQTTASATFPQSSFNFTFQPPPLTPAHTASDVFNRFLPTPPMFANPANLHSADLVMQIYQQQQQQQLQNEFMQNPAKRRWTAANGPSGDTYPFFSGSPMGGIEPQTPKKMRGHKRGDDRMLD